MGEIPPKKSTHGYAKSEKLCNFTLKSLLFNKGKSFFSHPFKFFWLVVPKNLEDIFFQKNSSLFLSVQQNNLKKKIRDQNPSYPLQKIPTNALFYYPAKCLTGVSKKSIKHAVKRNHLKRLMREAYRQNKEPLYSFLEKADLFLLLGIIYTAKQPGNYQEIEAKIIVSLQKIQESIRQHLEN